MNILTPGATPAGIRPPFARFHDRLRQRRFWAVQCLVLVATGVHWTMEAIEGKGDVELSGLFVVAMYALYFVPVIYASLNFGREGAIPTAIWSAVLVIPPIVFWHTGLDRVAESLQHLSIIVLAVVIANRVDHEVSARQEAEREGAARRSSEARYRGLFDSAGDAILVFDDLGIVYAANTAAVRLFDRPVAELRGLALEDIVGSQSNQLTHASRANTSRSSDMRLVRHDGAEIWLEYVCNVFEDGDAPRVHQALFRDVTEHRQRQHGLELYTRQIIQAQEEERRRIARDLHDGALQSVILVYRQLDLLEVRFAAASERFPDEMRDIRRQTEEIADELRRFSRDLRPSILDDLGLAPALRWLVNDLESRIGIQGRFSATDPALLLSPETKVGLFRIAQEALRNVERHSGARSVTVTLDIGTEHVRLTVCDDGKGIPADDPVPAAVRDGRLGLLGMQERARLLGGTLDVTSTPLSCTSVSVTIPITSTPS